MNKRIDLHVRLVIALLVVIFGCVLLAWGFSKPPEGEIHESVLIAFGEILTFSGTVLGINSSYRLKVERLEAEYRAHNQGRKKNTIDTDNTEERSRNGTDA